MNAYTGFAEMYDALMTDAPYDSWAAYIDGLLEAWFDVGGLGGVPPTEREKNDVIVLDLACGTGNITLRLAEKGYDLIGVDISEEMLSVAQSKSGGGVLFLAQDMRGLDLYGTVDAAVCVCDGMNYILEEAGLSEIFKNIKLFLNPGGVFIFDMNTEYKFNKVLGDQVFEGKGDSGEAYEWQNKYDPVAKINEYHVVFYSLDNDAPAFEELHRQRAYDPVRVCNMLLEAGFVSVIMRDGYTSEELKPNSERVVFIVAG